MIEANGVIQGRYRLKERIGRGGMAEVWCATDERLDRPAAVKFLAAQFHQDPEFLVRFFTEAQSVASISHPNVVQVLDFGDFEGRPYLVMEYVDGGSAADLTGAPLLPERASEMVAEAARGAGAAHASGFVHRDIKPANILLTSDGRAKLADFGIASSIHAERLTATGQAIGSPHYLSPEQASGAGCGPSSDVYSLGVVLYELITGRPPFDGDNVTGIAIAHVEQTPEPPSSFIPDLDPALEELVLRCLAKDPTHRYPDGTALAVALEDPLEAQAMFPLVYEDGDEDEITTSHRALAGTLITLLILGLLVAGVVAASRNSAERQQSYDQETIDRGAKGAGTDSSLDPTPSEDPDPGTLTGSSGSGGASPSPSPTEDEKRQRNTTRDGSGGGSAGGSGDEPEEEPVSEASPTPTAEPTSSPEPTPSPEPTAQEQEQDTATE